MRTLELLARGLLELRRFIVEHVRGTLFGTLAHLFETETSLIVLMQHRWPRPGIKCVGSGKKRARGPKIT